MSKTHTIRMETLDPKKHVVRFDTEEDEPLFNAVYVSRDKAKELFGIKDLDKVRGIEVTLRVLEKKG